MNEVSEGASGEGHVGATVEHAGVKEDAITPLSEVEGPLLVNDSSLGIVIGLNSCLPAIRVQEVFNVVA